MADDLGEKTEQPTAQRLQKARERGQAAKSQDLTSAVTMLASISILIVLGGGIAARLAGLMYRVLDGQTAGDPLSTGSAGAAITYAFREMVVGTLPAMVILFIVVMAAQFSQVGWLVSTEPIRPKLSKLDPLKGTKKLFDKRAMAKSAINTLKLAVVVIVTVLVIAVNMGEIIGLPKLEAAPGAAAMLLLMLELALWLLALLIILGVIDLIFQRWQHKQDLRMTKQEVKDEFKSMEGDPSSSVAG
jgi:flagellar biosynthetic protein FlhB